MKMSFHLNNRKLWAVIPAAGSGSRFSKTELKQYQVIGDKTILEHTISRLVQLPLAGYVLAIGADDHFAATLSFNQPEKAHFCQGGKERVHSVLNALHYLKAFAAPDDLIFVHDAARPCVTLECLENLVETALVENCSAILAIPVRDTLKRIHSSSQQIEHTVSREQLWQAQTPQISTFATLTQAIEQAMYADIVITDEASALEFMSEKVKVVAGRSDNLKITYPDDLELAKLILAVQQKVK